VDPSTRNKNNANVVTQETRWTWPEEVPQEGGDGGGDGGGGDGDWEEKTDPSSGRKYYVNKTTQETQWTKPGSKATWIENLDPGSGKMYYINTVTNETTWEKPADFDGGGAAAAEPADDAAKNSKFDKLRNLRKEKKGGDEGGAAAANPTPAAGGGGSGGGGSGAKTTPRKSQLSAQDKAKMKDLAMVDVGTVEVARMEDWAKPTEEGGLGKFNLDRKGMFGKRTQVGKILKWKNALVKTALLKLNSSMNVEAVQAFKNVVSFMGDRQTRKDAGGHAQKLMKNTLHAPEELRDEIFCQIIKQTTENPDPNSAQRGWQLMAIAAGTYPPSREFEPYLMYYCEEHKDDPVVGDLARSVQMRIKRIMDQVRVPILCLCVCVCVCLGFLGVVAAVAGGGTCWSC
jgi:hypothetical protein